MINIYFWIVDVSRPPLPIWRTYFFSSTSRFSTKILTASLGRNASLDAFCYTVKLIKTIDAFCRKINKNLYCLIHCCSYRFESWRGAPKTERLHRNQMYSVVVVIITKINRIQFYLYFTGKTWIFFKLLEITENYFNGHFTPQLVTPRAHRHQKP